jgi:hypothetical protein
MYLILKANNTHLHSYSFVKTNLVLFGRKSKSLHNFKEKNQIIIISINLKISVEICY